MSLSGLTKAAEYDWQQKPVEDKNGTGCEVNLLLREPNLDKVCDIRANAR